MHTNLQAQVPRRKKKTHTATGTDTDRDREETVSSDDPNFSITFCYEFLDDSYFKKLGNDDNNDNARIGLLSKYSWIRRKPSVKPSYQVHNDIGSDASHNSTPPQTRSNTELKANHPLMIMVKHERAVKLTLNITRSYSIE